MFSRVGETYTDRAGHTWTFQGECWTSADCTCEGGCPELRSLPVHDTKVSRHNIMGRFGRDRG
jgi:hypothetical protein